MSSLRTSLGGALTLHFAQQRLRKRSSGPLLSQRAVAPSREPAQQPKARTGMTTASKTRDAQSCCGTTPVMHLSCHVSPNTMRRRKIGLKMYLKRPPSTLLAGGKLHRFNALRYTLNVSARTARLHFNANHFAFAVEQNDKLYKPML